MQAFWQRVAETLRLNRLSRRWQKAARVLAVIVVFCTTYMLILPAITMEKETFCGTEDHIHTDECYMSLSAELGPDGETPDIWEATLSDIEFTQSAAENILAVARSQTGYTESELNYETDENGNIQGYTRYGQWYGNPYGNWNAMFASFCIYYGRAENADSLISSGISGMRYQWEQAGLFSEAEGRGAKTGEIIFIDTTADGEADHIGIISEVSESSLKVILGDWENSVKEVSLDNMSVVLGYGLTENLTVKEVAEEETTVEETTEEVITTEETTEEETTEKETEEETTQEVTQTQETTDNEVSDNIEEDSLLDSDENIRWQKEIEEYSSLLEGDFISSLEGLSQQEKQKVLELSYVIYNLPSYEEFITEIDRYYEADDMKGEEEYIKKIQNQMSLAYCIYQGYDDLQKYIHNSDKLFELMDLFRNMPQTYVTGTTDALTFNYINHTWNISSWDTSVITPIIVHGGSVNEKVGSAVNRYWWGVVVEYDSDKGSYYVSEVYESEGASTTSNAKILALEAETSKGFVVLVWTADNSATTAQKNAYSVIQTVAVGDIVNISMDPTTVSSNYNTSGYGTISFSEPVPEEPDPTTEDLPFTPDEPSDEQVVYPGATVTSGNEDVEISKSIDGTDIENVFDITLTVKTQTNVQTFFEDPDMAVVVVMDISNTMNSAYPSGSSTSRYDAAVSAAEDFINQYASITKGFSEIGFVAFNTHAHKILEMQPLTTTNASTLISEMKSDTEYIIDNYVSDDRTRFTNVEGGLKMGYDMLSESDNTNKYIIFLSDGFPTTYLVNNSANNTADYYEGYDPYTPSGTKGADGVFYDYVTGYYCSYGTSYSDKASIKARVMANSIKNLGADIFSIGINVDGQTIAGYERTGLSVIDRTSTTYEIGDASSTAAYQNWLKNSIGSGYYYDSTAKDDIANAFNLIFDEILALNKETKRTVWTATDPLPVLDENSNTVEFISFFNKDGEQFINEETKETYQFLEGVFEPYGEDEASHEDGIIYWDLKQSGYTEETDPNDENIKYYTYSVKYRVRLYNENSSFIENQVYETNGDAYLEYRTVTYDDKGNTDVSDKKMLYFPKPSVKGYLSEFTFTKVDGMGNPLEGAIFTLSHDDNGCQICHGDGTPVTSVSSLGPFKSASDGTVSFSNIPSGHKYILTETEAPAGYMILDKTYGVTVAYDEISFTGDWDGTTISNPAIGHILPETGGTGIYYMYIIGGLLITLSSVFLLCLYKKKKDRGRRRRC